MHEPFSSFVPCNSNAFKQSFSIFIPRFGPIATPIFISFELSYRKAFHWHSRSAMFAQRHRGIDPKRDKPALVDDYCKADLPCSYLPQTSGTCLLNTTCNWTIQMVSNCTTYNWKLYSLSYDTSWNKDKIIICIIYLRIYESTYQSLLQMPWDSWGL